MLIFKKLCPKGATETRGFGRLQADVINPLLRDICFEKYKKLRAHNIHTRRSMCIVAQLLWAAGNYVLELSLDMGLRHS